MTTSRASASVPAAQLAGLRVEAAVFERARDRLPVRGRRRPARDQGPWRRTPWAGGAARDIIQETRYHRRDRDLAEIETMTRDQLLHALLTLLPAQIDVVLFRLDVPPAYLPGPPATPASRITEALRWAEQQNRVADVERFYLEVTGSPVATPPAPAAPPASAVAMLTASHVPAAAPPPPQPVASASPMAAPITLFYSYSHKDEALRKGLESHLALLKRQGHIEDWHDRKIGAGTEWAGAIDANLAKADVVLLLVSAEFIASDYCYDKEMKRAIERHDAGEALVIPIALRPCDWSGAPFAKLQALPKDAKPVTNWKNRDGAWADVAKGIRDAVGGLRKRRAGVAGHVASPR